MAVIPLFLALLWVMTCESMPAQNVTTPQSVTPESRNVTLVLAPNPHCTFPGSPRHGRVISHQKGFPHNSTIEFGCDIGYMLLGPKRMRCVKGVWTKGVPYCVRDVARTKPAYLRPANPEQAETPEQLAVLALDGNDDTCAVTGSTWSPRMWGVALLEEATVSTLKVTFGVPLKEAQLEVRVGDGHPTTQPAFNRVCWTGTKDFEAHKAHYVKCDKPVPSGSYVSIHVRSAERAPLSLCTVEVHSDSGLSPEDACPHLTGDHRDGNNTTVELFHGKCIEFHTGDQRVPLAEARNICEDRGGRLVGRGLKKRGLYFLAWRAAKLFQNEPFWLDATSNQGAWTWGDGQDVSMELARDEETMGRCLAAGPHGTFEPADCDRGLRVVCQFEPLSCGTPHLPKALGDWALVDKLKVGQTLSEVRCEDGFYATSTDRLTCHKNGTLTGGLRCRPFTCGPPPIVNGASVRTLPPKSVEYRCTSGRFIKGESKVHCNSTSSLWSEAPQCERIMDFVSRKVGFVQKAFSTRISRGLKDYYSGPLSTQAMLGIASLILVLVIIAGLIRCVCLRHKSINKV